MEPRPRVQPLGETHTLGQAVQGIERGPVHEAVVPGVWYQPLPAQVIKKAIEKSSGQALEARIRRSLPAYSDDHVIALLPTPQKGGNELGRVLQVYVHRDDGIAGSRVKACGHSVFFSEVTGKIDDFYTAILGVFGPEDLGCSIRAAVVDENELETVRLPIRDGAYGFKKEGDGFLLIIAGNDERNALNEHGSALFFDRKAMHGERAFPIDERPDFQIRNGLLQFHTAVKNGLGGRGGVLCIKGGMTIGKHVEEDFASFRCRIAHLDEIHPRRDV